MLEWDLVTSVLPDVIRFVSDAHPRVRFAAITCLGQLASDFCPDLQAQAHALVVPALIQNLHDNDYPRLQERSLSAMFNFFDRFPEGQESIVKSYAEQVMTSTMRLLELGHIMVKEQAMTTIASLAGKITTDFLPYYHHVVPVLKQVIVSATDRRLLDIRSRAMESVTFIGLAVGPETFRADAAELVTIFSEIMTGDNIAADDTTFEYMLSSWTRICATLGKEFVPYLPLIIPHVFRAARKTVDIPSTVGQLPPPPTSNQGY